MTYFNLERIDAIKIAEMYAPGHVGYIHIKNGITESGREIILDEITSKVEQDFKEAPGLEGSVWQRFSGLQFGPADNGGKLAYKFSPKLMQGHMPCLADVLREYIVNIHDPLALAADFARERAVVNSIGIHRYPISGGTGYHRDYIDNVNLIGTVTLFGTAKFSFAQKVAKEGTEVKSVEKETTVVVEPGDVILMRAHRTKSEATKENDRRIFHQVECITQRYSLLFRTKCPKELIPA